MSLGIGAYKVGGAGQCSSMRRRYPWQPCEQPPPGTVTLNNSVQYLLMKPPLDSPRRLRNKGRNSILMMHHYPVLGSASDWLKQISHVTQPIRSTTQIWLANFINMEFLQMFLRHYFMGKPVVALLNVSCFLRLGKSL